MEEVRAWPKVERFLKTLHLGNHTALQREVYLQAGRGLLALQDDVTAQPCA